MRIAVAQIGARRRYAVPHIFHDAGLLNRLFTDVYLGNKPIFHKSISAIPSAIRPKIVERLLGRNESSIAPNLVTSFDDLGLATAFRLMSARTVAKRCDVYASSSCLFNERIIRFGLGEADAIYGYNSASVELFRWAKARGLCCVLDQTLAPKRIETELLDEELDRWSGWQPTLSRHPLFDPLAQREEEEWQLADVIVAGSEFVARQLAICGVASAKCRIVPSGVNFQPNGDRVSHSARPEKNKLRVLFAGEVGLRKGVPYLLEALHSLGPDRVESRFAGNVAIAASKLEPYRDVATFLGRAPYSSMAELYRWADVFVLPSICEGSAIVTYEALAAGIPVICTPNTGSIVRHGVDGFIVPIRDADAIANRLDYLRAFPLPAIDSPEDTRTPAIKFTLEAYGNRLLEAIKTTKQTN
jgi:glycosyltransferase involved in cell wall biosynthesis